MSSTIVCAVDEADAESRRVVVVADDLARRLGRPLVVAHVVPPEWLSAGGPALGSERVVVGPGPTVPYPYPVAPTAELEEVRSAAGRRVEHLLAQCGVNGAQVEVAVDASVADGLRQIAAARDAELLIVGSRGRGTLPAALLGSTSHALAADAPCPVLVVRVTE